MLALAIGPTLRHSSKQASNAANTGWGAYVIHHASSNNEPGACRTGMHGCADSRASLIHSSNCKMHHPSWRTLRLLVCLGLLLCCVCCRLCMRSLAASVRTGRVLPPAAAAAEMPAMGRPPLTHAQHVAASWAEGDTDTCTHMNTCVHTRIHTRTRTHVRTHATHTYSRAHTHAHMQICCGTMD